jgi:arabinan endo-1,5-alpha-L-arabinosidase
VLLLTWPLATWAQPLPLTGSTGAHDPVIAVEDGHYYLFTTGPGINVSCSDDLLDWSLCSAIFFSKPAWFRELVPGSGPLWAPDISYFNGRYHLYYSVSTFGSNRSAIGLATASTLDPNDPEQLWEDRGPVVASVPDDDWNAIDPNLVIDEHGQTWLAFGSFWSGIKMRRIDPDTGLLDLDDRTLYALAERPRPGAVEAPFIIRHSDHYILFVSFDQCCQGADSSYNIRVGRSEEVTGPYVDRDGVPMLEGGGTLILAGESRWRGPGHNAVIDTEEGTMLVYHSYDAEFGGYATLRIEPIRWDDEGWPTLSPEREE